MHLLPSAPTADIVARKTRLSRKNIDPLVAPLQRSQETTLREGSRFALRFLHGTFRLRMRTGEEHQELWHARDAHLWPGPEHAATKCKKGSVALIGQSTGNGAL
jgi:hypothetical protein